MKKYCTNKRKKHTNRGQSRSEIYKELRSYIENIPEDADLDEQARIIYERWSEYPLDHFLETTAREKRRVRRALENGEGWAARLLGNLGDPHFYSLKAPHLGLPPECGDPKNFYIKANVECWKIAIKASFAPPLRWKLELAEHVHVHVLADRDAGLGHLPRGGEIIKQIGDYDGLLLYLAKPYADWNARNLALYLRAKRRGRFPRLSGTFGLSNRKTWHSAATFTKGPS